MVSQTFGLCFTIFFVYVIRSLVQMYLICNPTKTFQLYKEEGYNNVLENYVMRSVLLLFGPITQQALPFCVVFSKCVMLWYKTLVFCNGDHAVISADAANIRLSKSKLSCIYARVYYKGITRDVFPTCKYNKKKNIQETRHYQT